ncbi:hypothetical protein GCM10023087_19320 [Microbacterium rhizosphaerae]
MEEAKLVAAEPLQDPVEGVPEGGAAAAEASGRAAIIYSCDESVRGLRARC